MSDATFILGMGAIIALAIGIPAYVRHADARYDERWSREFIEGPLRCFRIGCQNPAVEGKIHCRACIEDLKRKGVTV